MPAAPAIHPPALDAESTVAPGNAVPELEVLQLARIGAAVAVAPIDVVRAVMTAALDAVSAAHVDEVLLQSYLFAGFPRTLNATVAWRDVSGVPAPSADDEADVVNAPTWTSRGEATCRTVYGPTYAALRRHVARLHPALDAWMLVDGYGKVLSRSALPLVVRERCIVAVCAASDQRPQLGSHLRGARRCGATITELESTLDAIADLTPPDAMAFARAELGRITSATAPATAHATAAVTAPATGAS